MIFLGFSTHYSITISDFGLGQRGPIKACRV
jgi:hypothetical protein